MRIVRIFCLSLIIVSCVNSTQHPNNNPMDPQIYEVALVVDNYNKNMGKIIYLPKNSTNSFYITLNKNIKLPKNSYILDLDSDDNSVFSVSPTTCTIDGENNCPIYIKTSENINSSGNLIVKVHDIQSPNNITLKRIKITGE